MDKITIVEEIRKHDDLMSLPQALTEIIREIDKPDFGAEKLCRIVLKDPALTSRILKLANSSFYHRMSEITNVNQAVQILGMTTVKCLALSTSVFNTSKVQSAAGVDSKKFFAYILAVAASAEKIAKTVQFPQADEVFIAGLLHEIGTMFFLHHYPGEYRQVRQLASMQKSIVDCEQQVFGIDHCEVGFHLAKRWRLPDRICEAIADHHNATDQPTGVTVKNILRLACMLNEDTSAKQMMDIEDRMARINHLARCLNITKEQVDNISSSLLSLTVATADYLNIDIGDSYEILERANKELCSAYLMLENVFKERQELSLRLLKEERAKGAVESKNIAIATLSHYVNNAVMAVYGRSQILRSQLKKGEHEKMVKGLPQTLDVIDRSAQKIVAVLAEIKEISPIDDIAFYEMSQAMNIDDRIQKRMASLTKDTGIVLPDEANISH